MYANILETISQQWVRFDYGDAVFTSDRSRAAVIVAAQLESYIRNYELEYVRYSLTAEPTEPDTKSPEAHRVIVEHT